MTYCNVVQPRLFLLGFISVCFVFPLVSQNSGDNGIQRPKGFLVQKQTSTHNLAKKTADTLHYAALTKLKQDFVVNSGCGQYGADQHQINIGSDPHGSFLCAWNDDRAGDRQVDAQLFDNLGNRVGPSIHVSEGNANWNSEPHIVFNSKSNEYIVLWAGSGYDIEFQRLSSSGEKIAHNLAANQSFTPNTNNPSAAVDTSGNIIVTWTADQTCCMNAIPYCRVFDSAGVPITDQWSPCGTTRQVSSFGWDDRIAADSAGRCAVVWSMYLGNKSRIVLQLVNRSGNVYTEPITVSDPTDTLNHYFPTVGSTKDGHFLIVWQTDNGGIGGRIFHPDSGLVTPQFTVVYLQYYWMTYGVSSDDKNRFFVGWFADHPYGQIISTQGQFLGSAKVLTYSSTVTSASYPRLSKCIANRLFMAYGGYARSQMDVMVQAFDGLFNPVGNSVKAADDNCSAWQTNPVVKCNETGKSLVVWEDQRNGYHELYGQVLDESGEPVSGNIQITNGDACPWAWKPSISIRTDAKRSCPYVYGW